jgi:hypothetical protein
MVLLVLILSLSLFTSSPADEGGVYPLVEPSTHVSTTVPDEAPGTVIGTSLQYRDGIVYEDGVPVGTWP